MSFPDTLIPRCCFLAGPTASGKSALAMLLAERLGGEILALDSMTVYRGMDIGTAKADAAERQRVPHHLLDLVDPEEEYSIADYLAAATAAAKGILERGRVPLFVGGSGLYLRALLRGFSPGPAANWDIRGRWDTAARERGPEWIHGELQRVDPQTAARLHPQDLRRIIRALEVWEVTGRPISLEQQHGPRPPELRPRLAVWLDPNRDTLRDRIAQRTRQMLNIGWLDESQRLLQRASGLSRTAAQALGYRELFLHLRGELSLPEAVLRIQTSTSQFAKRQCTWFRSLEECWRLELTGRELPEEMLERLAMQIGGFAPAVAVH
ncbi:MAG: tRNA (adenosine(37)-N6)-dimethylallyltransferase MiaA [Planctomycetaceae bacterium]